VPRVLRDHSPKSRVGNVGQRSQDQDRFRQVFPEISHIIVRWCTGGLACLASLAQPAGERSKFFPQKKLCVRDNQAKLPVRSSIYSLIDSVLVAANSPSGSPNSSLTNTLSPKRRSM